MTGADQPDQLTPEGARIRELPGHQVVGNAGGLNLTEVTVALRAAPDDQPPPVPRIAFPGDVTGPDEPVEHPAHRLFLDSARRGQLALGEGSGVERVQDQQPGVGQVMLREPGVPLVLDLPGCDRQQSPEGPTLRIGGGHVGQRSVTGYIAQRAEYCDEVFVTSPAAVEPGRRRWLGLVVISLGVALIIVDSTIVNVAIPSIIADIGLTSTQAQWVQEIYILIFAALLLVSGRLADTYGRRRFFAIGVVVFAAASVLAALAQTPETLIAARAVQGLGGAMMLPTSLSLLNANFRGRDRGTAFGIWGATIGGTAALGPLLGGWLTTDFSWRWAFGINIPAGLVVLAGLFWLVPESREPHTRRGVDVGGAVLSAIGFGALVFGLIEGRTYGWLTSEETFTVGGWSWPWTLSPIPVAFVLGGAALTVFVLVERSRNRAGQVAMLDLNLFRIASFRNGNVAAAIVSLGEFGLLFALPLWLQNVVGYSAFETGLVLLALAIGSFAASGLGAVIGARHSPLYLVRLGIVLEIVGIAGISALIRPDSGWLAVVPPLFVYGVGVGFATAQLTGVVLADVPVELSGQGSGTQSTARQVGSAFGIAILGTILFSVLGSQFDAELSDSGVPDQQRTALVAAVKDSAGAAIPGLAADPRTAEIADQAKEAFTDATRLGWVHRGRVPGDRTCRHPGPRAAIPGGRGGRRSRRPHLRSRPSARLTTSTRNPLAEAARCTA